MSGKKPGLPPYYLAVVMFALGLFVATLIHTGSRARDSGRDNAHDVLFTLNGQPWRAADLPEPQASKWKAFHDQVKDWEYRLITSAALRAWFESVAESEGSTPEAVSKRLLGTEVSDDEVAAFYSANQDQLKAPYSELRDSIRAALVRHREDQNRAALLEKLIREGVLDIPTEYKP